MRTYPFTHQTEELKNLIAEHPDYQICVLAGKEASSIHDNYWAVCTDVWFEVGEILDTEFYDYDDSAFTDRYRLKEYIEESMYDKGISEGLSDDEFNAAVKAKLKELEPFWKDVIFIMATN